MIAHIRGKLLEKQPTRLVVEVGGVGLEVLVPFTTSQALGGEGEDVALHTVLVVREDALTLYGFGSASHRSLFLKLIGVSGIGPKIALNALSGSSVEDLIAALRTQDLAVLTRLPGIGKKTAARMALELKDALPEFETAATVPVGGADADAVAALMSLGYTRTSAGDAVKRAGGEVGAGAGAEALIRAALAKLTGG